jgi:hypothetical protein
METISLKLTRQPTSEEMCGSQTLELQFNAYHVATILIRIDRVMNVLEFVCSRPDYMDQTLSYPPRDAKVAKSLVQKDIGDIFQNNRSIAVLLIAMAEELTCFYETELRKHKLHYGVVHDWSSFILWVGQLLSPAYTRLSRLLECRRQAPATGERQELPIPVTIKTSSQASQN